MTAVYRLSPGALCDIIKVVVGKVRGPGEQRRRSSVRLMKDGEGRLRIPQLYQ